MGAGVPATSKILLEQYGQVDATINYGGPLNVASTVLGTEAFLLLAESSAEFRGFLQVVAELCLETYDQLTLSFNPGLEGYAWKMKGDRPY